QTGSPPLGDIAPADVRVSVDGGKTWQSTPARGVPDGQHAARSSGMTRGDGSLVMLFRTPQVSFVFDEGTLHEAAYYAWKPGATSWSRLTPTFDAEAVQQQWLAPAAGALETVWALIYRDSTLTYQGDDNYIKDGTYTITGCSLGSGGHHIQRLPCQPTSRSLSQISTLLAHAKVTSPTRNASQQHTTDAARTSRMQ